MSDHVEYSSLLHPDRSYTFKEVVEQSLAADGSLFVPRTLPVMDASLLAQSKAFDLPNLAYQLLSQFIEPDLSDLQLRDVIAQTFQFEIPIKRLNGSDLFVEELFHGPTHAFKDVGARFLAGCLKQWRGKGENLTVLVATSGDTGGAVANAFYGIEGIQVVVLYPKGKISTYQEQQIAGLGKNIKAIAVNGSFDDCQQLVKKAFSDTSLNSKIHLTSANSINIGRWIPQMMFYAVAWHFMESQGLEKNIIVPSGNYGNIAAGLLLHQMGFPFNHIIAAHNQNDTIPRFLESNEYQPHPTIATYANAMDVSDPSNFVRFQYLRKKGDQKSIQFTARSVNDQEILAAIRECWEKYNYLLDPHTATAYHVSKEIGNQGLLLSTAHPYKFKEIITKALGFYPEEWMLEEKQAAVSRIEMDVQLDSFKEILLQP
jgi:threonine synthase